MTTSEKVTLAVTLLVFTILAFKGFTEDAPHPLEGDQRNWLCLNGECFDGKGGYKKM